MGNQAPGTPVADPTVTPPVPPALDPAEEQRRENELLKKQLADKDRMIGEIKSEKETLEARLTTTQPKPPAVDSDFEKEAAEVLETAQVDPASAGKKLANLLKTATTKAQQDVLKDLQPRIEQNAYVSKIKEENQDLMDLGLEPAISNRALSLMQSGKPFKEAVDTAVKEARTKVEKLKSNAPPPPPTPPPSGAVGESGSNKPPVTPAPEPEVTDEDEVRKEREMKRKQGLG